MNRTKGRLAECPLPRLLVEISDSRSSGTLTVRAGGARRILAFKEGKLVGMQRPPEGAVEAAMVVAELESVAAATDGGFDWSGTPPEGEGDGASRDSVGLALRLLMEKTPMEHVGKEIYALTTPLRVDGERFTPLRSRHSPAEQAALRDAASPRSATEILERIGASERGRRVVVAGVLAGALTSRAPQRAKVEAIPQSRPTISPTPKATPIVKPAAPPAASASKASPVEARITPDELRDYVAAKRRTLSQSNHFQVLEVPRDAPRRVIEEHYLRFLKRYHPDTYYGEMEPETKDGIEEIFFRLNEAYNALIHTEKRQEYERLLAEGKVGRTQLSEDDIVMARNQAEQGRRALAEGDWMTARSSLDAARRLNPEDADVLGNLARAYLEGGVANRMPDVALEQIQRAIELEPYRASFHGILGDYWKVKGDKSKAAAAYQEALKLEPDVPGVERSLREVGGSRDGGGILGSLFKKKS